LSLAWGQMRNELRACGLELRDRLIRVRVGVYYRPPNQEEEVDEAFCTQLQAASQPQALVLVEDFTLTSAGKTAQPGTCNPGGSYRALMTTF